MPTVINLKDITTSDSQVSFAEKLNYNFNQLLTLGVGQPGPVGPQGPSGAPGPQGLSGAAGPRGTKWFTYADLGLPDTTVPTDVAFVPPVNLIYGDIYTNKRFDMYEYRNINGSGTWVKVVDIQSILSQNPSQSPLMRDFALAGSGNPLGTRFITFTNYLGADKTTGSTNFYYNDMLFLHNFDHTVVASEFLGSNLLQFYTAMNNIYVDHRVSNDGQGVRNHLELGALHVDGTTTKITKNNENLKIKYKIDGSPNGVRLAEFNISKNDGDDGTTLGNFNSAFKFSISKFTAGIHKTLDFALTSSEKTRQFTDLSFEPIDGLTLKSDTTKIAIGIKDLGADGKALGLIGSVGTGAPVGLYSNLPIYQIGSTAKQVTLTAENITFDGAPTNTRYILTNNADLILSSQRGENIRLSNNRVELAANTQDAALKQTLNVTVDGIGVGKDSIPVDTNKVPATSTSAPTANLMVNGSFGAGIRAILGASNASEMSLRKTDMTVIINDLPAGSTEFDLGSSITNTLRIIVLVNRSSNTVNIKGNNSTIGSLIAKQTVIYQSFGGTWEPLMTGPNTFATSGGSGGSGTTAHVWAALVVDNIVFHGTFTNGYRTADLKVYFYSDINGTLSVPVNNIEVRVTATDETFINNVSQGTQSTPWYGTCNGGNPHVVFPNIVIYTQEKDQFGPNKEDFNYIKTTTTFALECSNSTPPKNKQQDGTTDLKYTKVGLVPIV